MVTARPRQPAQPEEGWAADQNLNAAGQHLEGGGMLHRTPAAPAHEAFRLPWGACWLACRKARPSATSTASCQPLHTVCQPVTGQVRRQEGPPPPPPQIADALIWFDSNTGRRTLLLPHSMSLLGAALAGRSAFVQPLKAAELAAMVATMHHKAAV